VLARRCRCRRRAPSGVTERWRWPVRRCPSRRRGPWHRGRQPIAEVGESSLGCLRAALTPIESLPMLCSSGTSTWSHPPLRPGFSISSLACRRNVRARPIVGAAVARSGAAVVPTNSVAIEASSSRTAGSAGNCSDWSRRCAASAASASTDAPSRTAAVSTSSSAMFAPCRRRLSRSTVRRSGSRR
jgi:hypothetical protein